MSKLQGSQGLLVTDILCHSVELAFILRTLGEPLEADKGML